MSVSPDRLMRGAQVKQLHGLIELYNLWHLYELRDDEVVDIVGIVNAAKEQQS